MKFCPGCMRHVQADVIPAYHHKNGHLLIPSFLVCTHCGWNLTPTESEAV
jgi:hypothetical protein